MKGIQVSSNEEPINSHKVNNVFFLLLIKVMIYSGGFRNIIPGGAVSFFRSENCFDAPSHIPYVFVVRAENKMHIVNIAC